MYQLDKSTSSREHAFWRFGTGNKQTLWDDPLKRGEDVRSRLIEWQERHYSANLMKLVVLGKGQLRSHRWLDLTTDDSRTESLDDMTKTVVEKFSSAPNRNLLPPAFPGNPLGPEQLGVCHPVHSIALQITDDNPTLDGDSFEISERSQNARTHLPFSGRGTSLRH